MSEQIVTNASDKKQVKAALKREKSHFDRQEDQIMFVLSNRLGRAFLWRKLGECGIFKTSFSNSGSQVYFNEGMRQIGLSLLDEIMKVKPDAFLLMMKENGEENGN